MNKVVIKLLPDGSGRVRIHWFVHDDRGPVTTPASTTLTALGPLKLGGAKGRIACQPRRASVTPEVVGGVTTPIVHSDDVRAVTCPECRQTKEYWEVMGQLAEILETPLSAEDCVRSIGAGV